MISVKAGLAAFAACVLVFSLLSRPTPKPKSEGPGMLGGFKGVPDAANDAGVEKARAAAEEHWKAQNGGQLDAPLTVEAVQKQVVAGTNYKLTLKGGSKTFEAVVWEKLPVHGGAFEVTSMKEVQAPAASADVFPDNPEVDDVAGYAVQQLSSQSNSLFPFTLKKVLSARVSKGGEGGVTHHLKLLLSHGSMPDSVYEVDVANPGGSYTLLSSQQLKA